MCEKVIEAALKLDTVTVTAASIYAQVPELFPDVTKVPRHVTTCLADLVSSIGWTLNSVVVISDGSDVTKSNGILIEPAVNVEAHNTDGLDFPDMFGSVKSRVSILIKGVKTSNDITLTRDIALRIIYILDNDGRAGEANPYMVARDTQDIDTSADPAILHNSCGGRFSVRWMKSDQTRIGEGPISFLCEYSIVFP